MSIKSESYKTFPDNIEIIALFPLQNSLIEIFKI